MAMHRRSLDLSDSVKTIRGNWMWILLFVAVGALVSGIVSYLTPTRFQATVTQYVSAQTPGDSASNAYQGGLLSEQRMTSYADLMLTQRVAEGAIQRTQIGISSRDLLRNTDANAKLDTVILTTEVRDTSPANAVNLANGMADSFSELVAEIERPTDPNLLPPVVVRTVQPAVLAPDPVSPRIFENLLLGVATALVIGVATVLFWRVTDATIGSRQELEEVSSIPILGEIPEFDSGEKTSLFAGGESFAAEQYRRLRTNLQYLNPDVRSAVITVTSPEATDGKTTTICNLGWAIALSGSSVIVVDADLRRPAIATDLNLEPAVGLTTVLTGRTPIDRATQRHYSGLAVMTSGPLPPNPAELVSSLRMREMVSTLRQNYDFVLIDTPPVGPVVDGAQIAVSADLTILVCRYNISTIPGVQSAIATLEAVGRRPAGVVVNRVKNLARDSRYKTYSRSNLLEPGRSGSVS